MFNTYTIQVTNVFLITDVQLMYTIQVTIVFLITDVQLIYTIEVTPCNYNYPEKWCL